MSLREIANTGILLRHMAVAVAFQSRDIAMPHRVKYIPQTKSAGITDTRKVAEDPCRVVSSGKSDISAILSPHNKPAATAAVANDPMPE